MIERRRWKRNPETKKIDLIIGQRVKSIRKKRGFSEREVGECLGVSSQQVQKYQNGENVISASAIKILSQRLQEPIKSFYPSEDDEITKNMYMAMNNKKTATIVKYFERISNPATKDAVTSIVKNASKED